MKRFSLYITIFSFIFISVSHSQALNPDQLKKVTGKSGIVAEPGEIVIKIKNKDISKAIDSGAVTDTGIKLGSNKDYSVLRFKPVQETDEYSNKNLRKVFGDQIGSAGLNNNIDSNINIEDTKNLLSKTNFLFPINLSGISSAFTLIDLYNENGLNTSETKLTLPAAEAETEPFTKDIMLFTNQKGKTDNQHILTIESGTTKTAILGGRFEIINNFND